MERKIEHLPGIQTGFVQDHGVVVEIKRGQVEIDDRFSNNDRFNNKAVSLQCLLNVDFQATPDIQIADERGSSAVDDAPNSKTTNDRQETIAILKYRDN